MIERSVILLQSDILGLRNNIGGKPRGLGAMEINTLSSLHWKFFVCSWLKQISVVLSISLLRMWKRGGIFLRLHFVQPLRLIFLLPPNPSGTTSRPISVQQGGERISNSRDSGPLVHLSAHAHQLSTYVLFWSARRTT